jgi:hypothetical protein
MFHNKVKLLEDKQYYGTNATGMDQKGVKMRKVMNFLRLFYIINHFLDLYLLKTKVMARLLNLKCTRAIP